MPRVAAIDVGTNSVRCLIAEPAPGGTLHVLDDLRAYTRLGRGVAYTGLLSSKPMARTVEALGRMTVAAASLGVDETRAVATAAVRSACNAPAFIDRVREHLGLELEVISPEEEGRLAHLSAAHAFDLGERAAVFDLGGGSLEIVLAREGHAGPARSAPIGALTLSERFVDGDPISSVAFERVRAHVREQVAELVADAPVPVTALVGSGGTVRAIAALTRRRRATDGVSTHGAVVPVPEIRRLVERLRSSTAEERVAMPRMPRRRADIITAGVLVVAEVASALRVDSLQVNAMGVREGIVLDTLARLSRGYR